MSDQTHPFNSEKSTSATPLDILLNAINGRGDFHFPHDLGVGVGGLEQVLSDSSGHVMGELEGGDLNDGDSVDWGGGRIGEQDEGIDGLLAASRMMTSVNDRLSKPIKTQQNSTPSPRQNLISQTLKAHVIQSSQNAQAGPSAPTSDSGWKNGFPSSLSTVEVWHGAAAQKSYGKEKRLLNPPPILRVKGALFPSLTTATLSIISTTNTSTPTTSSSQTHAIPLVPIDMPSPFPISTPRMGRLKKAEREAERQRLREAASRSGFGSQLVQQRNKLLAKERSALDDGLSFNGLWIVGESERGKEKVKRREYNLQLNIGQPGVEAGPSRSATTTAIPQTSASQSSTEVLEGSSFDLETNHGAFATSLDPGEVDEATSTIINHLHAATANQDDSLSLIDPDLISVSPVKVSSTTTVNPTLLPHSWATFISSPISIVTKPSKKTSKARSLEGCISEQSSFGLWVRVNGQTVRTKYMKLDAPHDDSRSPTLMARIGKWTPFHFEVVSRAKEPENSEERSRRNKPDEIAFNNIITYGSIVVLKDRQTGIRSEHMKVIRVDKNEVGQNSGQGNPMSEHQRVGFVRMENGVEYLKDGCRWYLSAPGATIGAGEMSTTRKKRKTSKSPESPQHEALAADDSVIPDTLDGVQDITGTQSVTGQLPSANKSLKRKKSVMKTKRNALAIAAIAEDEDGSTKGALSWVKASQKEVSVDGNNGPREYVDIVDDFMSWVIGSVACFTHTFFDATGVVETLPSAPIDPVPRVLMDPIFHRDTNTLELTLSSLQSATTSDYALPLDVYLGPIGPLKHTIWKSTSYHDGGAPRDNRTGGMLLPALPLSDSAKRSSASVYSGFPDSIPHIIVRVEMPNPEDIIRIMQGCTPSRAEPKTDTPNETGITSQGLDDEPIIDESHAWMAASFPGGDLGSVDQMNNQHLTPGELTIQEALRNAGKSSHVHDLAQAIQQSRGEFGMDIEETQFPRNSDLLNGGIQDTSGSEMFLDSIHPLLRGEGKADTLHIQPKGQAGDGQPGVGEKDEIVPVSLILPESSHTGNNELVPLPLMLVRKSDGIAFGTGKNVIAEKLLGSGNENGGAQWGLRVVNE